MFQLWTISKLPRLAESLRREVTFYAPLLESLDFMGIDPVTFTRAATSLREGRDGLSHFIAANVPKFDFSAELARGCYIQSGQTLQFSAQNGLDNANTLVWFEDSIPKSTPTNTNPFSSSGIWTGNLNIALKHVLKVSRVCSNAEINAIQTALADVAQSIPAPETAGDLPPSTFVATTPAGVRNGTNTVFTLPSDPNPNSMILDCFGATLEWVSPGPPGQMEFTLTGAGNRTITLGMGPTTAYPFIAHYVTA